MFFPPSYPKWSRQSGSVIMGDFALELHSRAPHARISPPRSPLATSLGVGEIHAQPHQVSFDSEASNATGDWTERPDGWVRRCPFRTGYTPCSPCMAPPTKPQNSTCALQTTGREANPAAAQSTKETLGESRPAEGRFVGSDVKAKRRASG